MSRENLQSRAGFSLLGVMVAAGIGMILMTAIASQLISSSQQIRYLEAKIESINMKQELIQTLANAVNCNATFSGKTVNLASDASGTYTILTDAINGTPLKSLVDNYALNSRYISISGIRLFKPYNKSTGGLNNSSPYEFHLKIAATEKGSLTGRLINVDGPRILFVITAPPVIASCAAISSGGTLGSCSAGQTMIGINLDGTPQCIVSGSTGGSCPTGQVVTGLSSTGAPICSAPPSSSSGGCPPGTTWQAVPLYTKYIDSSGDGVVWGMTEAGTGYVCR